MSARAPVSVRPALTILHRNPPARRRTPAGPLRRTLLPSYLSSSPCGPPVACHDHESAFHVGVPVPTELGTKNGIPARLSGLEVDPDGIGATFELLLDPELLDFDAVQAISRVHHQPDRFANREFDFGRLERIAAGHHLDHAGSRRLAC